jgi:hypothetical protein
MNRLSDSIETNLDEQHAAILWTLWIHRDKKVLTVPRAGLLELVHGEQESYGRGLASAEELDDRLNALEKLGAIELKSDDILIRERVRTRFTSWSSGESASRPCAQPIA